MGGATMTPLTKIAGYGHVAIKYGMEEAVFLDAIMFWWRTNRRNGRNNYEGRWWTYNSVETYSDIFPWWSAAQIRRIIARCKDKGALLVANFNEDKRDRTLWYSPSDELLTLYGENFVTCNCSNEQMHGAEGANTSDENSEPLPCSYHVATTGNPPIVPPEGEGGAGIENSSPSAPQELPNDSTSPPNSPPPGEAKGAKPKKSSNRRKAKSAPKHKPEVFELFWDSYPRKDGRQEAIAAWDKLAPDDETIAAMARGLAAAKKSEKWTKEEGRYIEWAVRWIKYRRWENQGVDHTQIKTKPAAQEGGWAEDRGNYA